MKVSALLIVGAAWPVFSTGPFTQSITGDQAIALARNDLQMTPIGVELSQPDHGITFTAEGITVKPRRGPVWEWSLVGIGSGAEPCDDLCLGNAVPAVDDPALVTYQRGRIEEQYVLGQTSVEQRFVLLEALDRSGRDLAIEGRVESAGILEQTSSGWRWLDERGAVTLGDVFVYDANGHAIPASMRVEPDRTQILVDGSALANAAYPVVVDPEIGTNDFRISDMGPDGGTLFTVGRSAVAYNPTEDEYLVVWSGMDATDEGREIYGQRLDGATGAEIGPNDFRISDMGPDAAPLFDAFAPAVVYNALDGEYLVVWFGDDDEAPLAEGEFEIFGQRLTAAGTEVGTNDFRISDMGPDGDASYQAVDPAVIHNALANEYLVVWSGDDDTASLQDGEFEIRGQRLDSNGTPLGINDFRVSDMGPDGDTSYSAVRPAVALNPADGEYLVVWFGDDDVGPLVDDELEVFGQRLNAATGAEMPPNDFRISSMGPDGAVGFGARSPDVAYNSQQNEYFVVWTGDDVLPGETEVYGQRLAGGTVLEIGADDVRLSDVGLDGRTVFSALDPAVVYNSTNNEYLIVWSADEDDGEFEIYGQRGKTNGEIGLNDFRISDMGPDGSVDYDAGEPALAHASGRNEYLIVWTGDDDAPPLVANEEEIFGQRFALCPFELPSKEIVRLGDPPNPAVFLPGVTSGPVVGSTWDPVIDHTDFLPGAVLDFAGISGAPDSVATPFGTLLCAMPNLIFLAAPGDPFQITLPDDCSLAGALQCTQGGSLEADGDIQFTNALDITIGTF